MRTPLSSVRGRGSAKFGTDDYWVQRLTAAVLVPLSVVLIIFLVRNGAASHATVREALANPICAVLVAAAIIAGVVHMRIGMQVIIEDYTPSDDWKLVFILLNNFFSALVALAILWAVAKLSFGM